jgi:hypothetical protein
MASSPQARLIALIHWCTSYSKRHPDAGTITGRPKTVNEEDANSADESVNPTEIADSTKVDESSAPRPPKAFARVLQYVLGMSPAAADRLAREARNLTEEDVEVLAEKKVTGEVVNKIAALGDGEAKKTAVKLIASGLNPEEAVRQATPLKVPKPKKAPKAGKAAAVRPSPKQIEMTDDEWLRTNCSMIMSQLKHKTAF